MNERLKAIKEILKENDIETQEHLQMEVEKLGFQVTQATISRDIAKLGLIKRRDSKGKFIYMLPEQETFSWLLKQMLITSVQAQNMVVLKVKSGTANAVAAEIDSIGWQELVGSIAGDDTILLITRDNPTAKTLINKINEVNTEKNDREPFNR